MNRTFEIVSEEIKYENPWMRVLELQTLTDGKRGIYGIVERSNSATVIVETDDSRILFVRQYRYPIKGFSWELPMGGIDEGELPQMGAIRELEEETGCRVPLRKIGEFRPVPGLTPQTAYVYYGSILAKDIINILSCERMSDEITERKFFNREQIRDMIDKHEISDGFTLSSLAILFFGGHI